MRPRPYSVNPTVKRAARHAFLVLLFYSLLFTVFFSPVLFYDSLLAPGAGRLGDGLLYHLTYFQSKKVFWDTLLSAGFPMTADPQVMAWYPPSMVLSLLPGMWNVFVVSAYVMASCFTYGYVYALTQSRLSSLVAGIVYGMCGFMIAHQGHTAIIHVAAWPPLIIWSLEMLRRKFSRGWFAVGCFAVACCVLAGHLQIVAYSLLLAMCYAMVRGWSAPATRRRYYLAAGFLLLIGIGLAALQVLSTLELAKLSTRSEYAFADFVSYSLPVTQSVSLIFPAAFGGLGQYGSTPYFGAWNLTELAGYVGLLPLMLAALGFAVTRRKTVSIFWLCVAAIAFLLTLGDQTPLASLTYYLPVLGKFRAPARHFIEMALAVSVLAGIGAHAVLRAVVTKRLLWKTLVAAASVVIATLVVLISKHSTEYALIEGGSVRMNGLPWANPAIATPLIVFVVTTATLYYWYRLPTSSARIVLLLLVLVVDLGSFGWFHSWHEDSPNKSVLNEPAFAARYRDSLGATNQRILPVRGTSGTRSELPPNLSRLWGIPSASGYTPLTLSNVTTLLSLRQDGSADPSWKDSNNQSLDVMSVRYVLTPRPKGTSDADGVLWSDEQMGSWLGGGCDHAQRSPLRFDLKTPVRATSLAIVSRLACSTGMPEGTEVVRVSLTSTDGSIQDRSMVAGQDTSEWAYDCRTVTPGMRHRRASIYSTFPATMNSEPCVGHFYVTKLKLDGARDITGIELQWTGQAEAISIEKLTLVDEVNHTSEPLSSLSMSGTQWRLVEEVEQTRIYENMRALPRAWLVTEVLTLTPEQNLTAIKTSRLPNGESFDPSRTAVVESPLTIASPTSEAGGTARIVTLTDTVMEIQTSSPTAAFLVTSDAYYPGWRASVDGASVQIFRANYAIRGVQVPSGNHLVRFEFVAATFYYGAGLSALSLLALAGVFWWSRSRRKRFDSDYSVDKKTLPE